MAYMSSYQLKSQPQALAALPDGPAGIRATLRQMAKFAREQSPLPDVRQLALHVIGHLPGKAWAAEAEALRAWVAGNIRYTRDIEGIETLQTPAATLVLRAGDCDDQATLLASLLLSVGFRVRFAAIGSQSGEYEHVLAETLIPGSGWLTVETTEPVQIGWQPKNVRARMVQDV